MIRTGTWSARRYCRILTDGLIAAELSASLLICWNYHVINYVKYAAFLSITGAYSLALLAGMAALPRSDRNGLRALLREHRAPLLLAGAYLFCTILSAAFSPYQYNRLIGMTRWEGLLTQTLYLCVFTGTMLWVPVRTPWSPGICGALWAMSRSGGPSGAPLISHTAKSSTSSHSRGFPPARPMPAWWASASSELSAAGSGTCSPCCSRPWPTRSRACSAIPTAPSPPCTGCFSACWPPERGGPGEAII